MFKGDIECKEAPTWAMELDNLTRKCMSQKTFGTEKFRTEYFGSLYAVEPA